MKTCTKDNCDRAHRARGLCASHYNQEHAPDRHAKKLVACAVCGTEVLKNSGGSKARRPTCSNECRASLTGRQRQAAAEAKCKLPDDHWALWFGKASAWPRAGWKDCAFCGSKFPANRATAKYCSRGCTWRWHDRANGVQSAADIYTQVRRCTRCGNGYQHESKQREHCSDYCRDKAADERGATLHRGWIRTGVRLAIYERDNYMCWLCNEPVDRQAHPQRGLWAPTLDHVIPRAQGGTHDERNLRTAHRWCNSVRSDSGADSIFDLAT